MKKIVFLLAAAFMVFSCKKDSNYAVTINNVMPLSDGPGALITIKGSGFGSNAAEATVLFNGTNAAVESISDTVITVRVPVNATTGQLQVAVKNHSGIAPNDFVVLKGNWIRMADIPGDGRANLIAFTVNGIGYAGMGFNGGSAMKDFYAYNPSLNTWSRKSDFPGLGKYRSTAVAANGKGYVFCGSDNDSAATNDVWQYDPASDQWTQKKDFPGSKRFLAAAFAIGTKIYFGTGTASVGQADKKDWWEYNTQTDTWVQKTNFPGTARAYAAAISIGTKGYLGIGIVPEKDWWEYDPATDTWTRKADYPGEQTFFQSAFVIGNAGYIVTGTTQYNWRYDPSNNSWSQRTSHPSARAGGMGFSINDKGYLTGGVYNGYPDNKLFQYSEN